jgi:hypothetical protein
MKGLALWHRQGRRTSRVLLAISNVAASVEGASRAVNFGHCNSIMLLIRGPRSTALHTSCGIGAIGIRWVVLGKAGPRRAWRCSSSSWRARGLVQYGSHHWRCCAVGTRSGSSVARSSVSLGAQPIIEPGPAGSVAPSGAVASVNAVAAEATVVSSRRSG